MGWMTPRVDNRTTASPPLQDYILTLHILYRGDYLIRSSTAWYCLVWYRNPVITWSGWEYDWQLKKGMFWVIDLVLDDILVGAVMLFHMTLHIHCPTSRSPGDTVRFWLALSWGIPTLMLSSPENNAHCSHDWGSLWFYTISIKP